MSSQSWLFDHFVQQVLINFLSNYIYSMSLGELRCLVYIYDNVDVYNI